MLYILFKSKLSYAVHRGHFVHRLPVGVPTKFQAHRYGLDTMLRIHHGHALRHWKIRLKRRPARWLHGERHGLWYRCLQGELFNNSRASVDVLRANECFTRIKLIRVRCRE